MPMGDASLDLEDVASDGEDGPPQALAGSVVAGGVGAMDTLADMAAAVVGTAARVLAELGLQRWVHRAQPLSRREREIPSSVSGCPCPACRVVTSSCLCSSLGYRCGHEQATCIEQLGPVDCALVKDMLIGHFESRLVVQHEDAASDGE